MRVFGLDGIRLSLTGGGQNQTAGGGEMFKDF
jgi:hypothetical protein